ncbi:hypothetical protein MtrunA17_Chr3g0136121 [Medicago truncatula]|uniref:Uncharacterized protein n=1 Tax=Medicago truncatula TaxID=3880 RepID=A0A396J273_MEDTR|nr:hypothetical protein MtrunA17_Chr3g0136121 [Medicago truncatula]
MNFYSNKNVNTKKPKNKLLKLVLVYLSSLHLSLHKTKQFLFSLCL